MKWNYWMFTCRYYYWRCVYYWNVPFKRQAYVKCVSPAYSNSGSKYYEAFKFSLNGVKILELAGVHLEHKHNEYYKAYFARAWIIRYRNNNNNKKQLPIQTKQYSSFHFASWFALINYHSTKKNIPVGCLFIEWLMYKWNFEEGGLAVGPTTTPHFLLSVYWCVTNTIELKKLLKPHRLQPFQLGLRTSSIQWIQLVTPHAHTNKHNYTLVS